jgi:hypothetical protein
MVRQCSRGRSSCKPREDVGVTPTNSNTTTGTNMPGDGGTSGATTPPVPSQAPSQHVSGDHIISPGIADRWRSSPGSNPSCRGGWRARGGGIARQINTNRRVGHSEGSRLQPTARPGAAGVGRSKVATSAATRIASRVAGELGLGFARERRGKWAGSVWFSH